MKYQSDYSSDQSTPLEQNQYQSQEQIQAQESDSQQQQQRLNKLKLEQQNIKAQLKQLPYGLILKQKQQLAMQKAKIQSKQASRKTKHIQKAIQKNEDKYAPKQLPIHKKPKKQFGKVIFQPKRPKTVDPRFQNYAGTYNKDLAMKSFDFIPKIQQEQINHIKKRLHSKSKKDKLSSHERDVLLTEYNKLTSERKKVQIDSLKHKVLTDIRKQRTQSKPQSQFNRQQVYHPKKSQFRERLQKQKIKGMSQNQRKKHLVKKNKQLQKNQASERSNFIYQSTIRGKKQRY